MAESIAVLGTGIIGAPVARNLSKAGFTVRAWNRTPGKSESLAAEGVTVAASAQQAVLGAGVVLTVLTDGAAVLEAIRAATPAPGTVWVQLSTVGEAIDDLVAYAREHDLRFVDATVQGTRQPAETGQLVVLAAGDKRIRKVAQPLFDAIGKTTVWVDDNADSGAASRLKLVLNTWVVALTSGVGEALALAERLNVNPQHFVEVVTGGPMDNAFFQAKSTAIRKNDYTTTFSVDNAEKDARLVLDAATRTGIRMDTVAAGRARFNRASEAGHGDKDMAASYFASFEN